MDTQNLRNITVNGKPLGEHFKDIAGSELREVMQENRQGINRSLNRGGRSLAYFAPTKFGGNSRMATEPTENRMYKVMYALLANNGKEFTTQDLAKTVDIDARSLSNTTSRFKAFIKDSGDVDGIFKAERKDNNTYFKCLVNSVDNPKQWALKYLSSFQEFEKVAQQIYRENKKNGEKPKSRKSLPTADQMKERALTKPENIQPAQQVLSPIRQGAGSPIDVPINISITVSVDFMGGNGNVC